MVYPVRQRFLPRSQIQNLTYITAPPLRNRTIRGVAENAAMQVEIELFEHGIMRNRDFLALVLQWERRYASASQYLEAERLRAAVQRIRDRQPLPPIGPPLIAADIFPTVAGASPARVPPVQMPARSNQPAPSQSPSSNNPRVSSRTDVFQRVVDTSPARTAPVQIPTRSNQAAPSQRPPSNSPRVSARTDVLPTVVDPSPARVAPVSMPARHSQASAAALGLAQLALGGGSEDSSQPRNADRGDRADRRGTRSSQNVQDMV